MPKVIYFESIMHCRHTYTHSGPITLYGPQKAQTMVSKMHKNALLSSKN